MDSSLRRRRAAFWIGGGVAAAAIVAYASRLERPRRLAERARAAADGMVAWAEAASEAGHAARALAAEARAYLASDAAEPPQRVRQALRLLRSEPAQDAAAAIAAALVRGASEGASATVGLQAVAGDRSGLGDGAEGGGWVESALTERGIDLMAALAGRVAERCLLGYYAAERQRAADEALLVSPSGGEVEFGEDGRPLRGGGGGASFSSAQESMIGQVILLTAGHPRSRSLVLECLARAVKVGVETYARETAGTNMFDDIVSSVTNPSHAPAFTELTTAVTREAVLAGAEAALGATTPLPSRSGGAATVTPATMRRRDRGGADDSASERSTPPPPYSLAPAETGGAGAEGAKDGDASEEEEEEEEDGLHGRVGAAAGPSSYVTTGASFDARSALAEALRAAASAEGRAILATVTGAACAGVARGLGSEAATALAPLLVDAPTAACARYRASLAKREPAAVAAALVAAWLALLGLLFVSRTLLFHTALLLTGTAEL